MKLSLVESLHETILTTSITEKGNGQQTVEEQLLKAGCQLQVNAT